MKRVVPLLLLTALGACTDRDVVQPAQHTLAVQPRSTLTPTGPLPATRQFWKDDSTLWVYNSQPELGVDSNDGSYATNSFVASQNMRFVRVELPWDSAMEDQPYHYTSAFSGFRWAVNNYIAAGITPVVVVVYDENLHHGAPPGVKMGYGAGQDASASDLATFNQRLAAYMAAAADTFPEIKFWEVWNEVDGGWWGQPWAGWNSNGAVNNFPRYVQGQRYAATLQAVYPAIKNRHPDDWVLITSLTGTESFKPGGTGYVINDSIISWNFLQGVYAAGGGKYFDFMNVHAYGSSPTATSQPGGSMLSKASAVQSVMAQYDAGQTTRPMWLTEAGTGGAQYLADHGGVWPHSVGLNDDSTFNAHQKSWWTTAASYLSTGPYVKSMAFALSTSVGAPSGTGIFPAGRTAAEYGNGLRFNDGTARPALTYLAGSGINTSVLANPLGQGTLTVYSPSRDPIGYHFTRSGSYVYVDSVQVNNLAPTTIRFTPPPPLTGVTISGPTRVRPGATCTWTATPTGGTSPFSYGWIGVTGSQTSQTTTSSWSTSGNKTISVQVDDAAGGSVSALRGVSVSSTAPAC